MSDNSDIRWIQRLDNFNRALLKLESAVELDKARSLSDIEKQGLIPMMIGNALSLSFDSRSRFEYHDQVMS